MKYPRICKLWKVVSKDPLRPQLGNVFLSGGKMVATDGVTLAAVRVTLDEGEPQEAALPAEALKAAAKTKEPEAMVWLGERVKVFVREKTIEVNYPERGYSASLLKSLECHLTEAERRKREPVLCLKLNAKRLADLAEALGSPDGAVTLYVAAENIGKDGKLASVGLTVEALGAEVENIGVIMPIVGSED